jgi:hypothetical protein
MPHLKLQSTGKRQKLSMIWCDNCAQSCNVRAEVGFLSCNWCGKVLGEHKCLIGKTKGNKIWENKCSKRRKKIVKASYSKGLFLDQKKRKIYCCFEYSFTSNQFQLDRLLIESNVENIDFMMADIVNKKLPN